MTASAPPLGSVVRILDELKPRPRLTVSKWADRYRRIAPGTSPEPGLWRTDRAPYTRGIMDALNEPGIETVVAMVASQLGKTEVELNILGYFVDQDPSPILFVQPTIEAMESFSKERIEPTFRATPALRGKLEDGKDGRGASRKSGQTIRLKMFPGGYLAMAGSNAPAGLASRPIRVVLCDELDRFADSSGTEGDPVKLAIQRTSNFHNRKIVLVSTPTIDGLSKIQQWYEQGDRRQFLVTCPHCGTSILLRWDRVCYKNAAGERDFDHIRYLCQECEQPIEERHKLAMLASGEWVAQRPGGKIASFGDLSALYSPWVRWRTLVEEWCAAHDSRDRRGLQEFVNLRLGQPWVEHQQEVDQKAIDRHRHRYDCEVPDGVVLLTAGVDTQGDRLEVEVVGWGRGRESWGISYQVLMGDPGFADVWRQLDQVLARSWQTKDGRALQVACTCVDSGGNHTQDVYAYCRLREARNVWAIKGGKDGPGQPAIGKPTRNNRHGAALFVLGVHDIKCTVWSRLLLEHEGHGYCHWPVEAGRGYDQAYFDGFLSERLVTKQVAGKKVQFWKAADHARNEPWDCRVYATAALQIRLPDPAILDILDRLADSPAAAHPQQQRTAARRVLSRGVSV